MKTNTKTKLPDKWEESDVTLLQAGWIQLHSANWLSGASILIALDNIDSIATRQVDGNWIATVYFKRPLRRDDKTFTFWDVGETAGEIVQALAYALEQQKGQANSMVKVE